MLRKGNVLDCTNRGTFYIALTGQTAILILGFCEPAKGASGGVGPPAPCPLLLSVAWGARAESVDYSRNVRPILEKSCVGCHHHGSLDQPALSGGLALDSYDAVLKGGRGPIVKPGQASESELLRRLEASDPAVRMPRGGQPLPAEAIAVIRQWIEDGAGEGMPAESVISPPDTRTTPRVAVRAIDVFVPFGRREPVRPTMDQLLSLA